MSKFASILSNISDKMLFWGMMAPIVLYIFYQLFNVGALQLVVKPLWLFIQKIKFKGNPFFFTMYCEKNDHLWHGYVICYLVIQSNGISLISNTLFPKKIFIPYSDVKKITISLDYSPRSVPIEDLRDLYNIDAIDISSNTYGKIHTDPMSATMPYLNRYIFRHNINFCRDLYQHLDNRKIKLDILHTYSYDEDE